MWGRIIGVSSGGASVGRIIGVSSEGASVGAHHRGE